MGNEAIKQHKQMAMGKSIQGFAKGGSVGAGKAPTNKTPVTTVKAPTPTAPNKGKISGGV